MPQNFCTGLQLDLLFSIIHLLFLAMSIAATFIIANDMFRNAVTLKRGRVIEGKVVEHRPRYSEVYAKNRGMRKIIEIETVVSYLEEDQHQVSLMLISTSRFIRGTDLKKADKPEGLAELNEAGQLEKAEQLLPAGTSIKLRKQSENVIADEKGAMFKSVLSSVPALIVMLMLTTICGISFFKLSWSELVYQLTCSR